MRDIHLVSAFEVQIISLIIALSWDIMGQLGKQKSAVCISTAANPTVPTPLFFGSVAEHHPLIPRI